MAGNRMGGMKTGAKALGIPVAEYVMRIDNGQKWCAKCCDWHDRSSFPRSANFNDGRRPYCNKTAVRTKNGVAQEQMRCAALVPTSNGRQRSCGTVTAVMCYGTWKLTEDASGARDGYRCVEHARTGEERLIEAHVSIRWAMSR